MAFAYFDAAVNHGIRFAKQYFIKSGENVNSFLELRYLHYLALKNRSEEQKKEMELDEEYRKKVEKDGGFKDQSLNYEGWIARMQDVRNLLLKKTDYVDCEYTIDEEFIQKRQQEKKKIPSLILNH